MDAIRSTFHPRGTAMIDRPNAPIPDDFPDDEEVVVNDSLGTINIADTMDTDPDEDPEAGGKGIGEKMAE